MKAINDNFRCDLCGRFSNFGVTESYALPGVPGERADMQAQSTVCVRCISNATALLFDGLCRVTSSSDDDPTSTADSSSE